MPNCDDSYLEPYREAIRQHGPGFAATLWAERSGQQLRFDVMIDLADFEGCSLIDAGCGQGDFAARLLERDVHFTGYLGIDGIPEMIAQAKDRKLARCEFVAGDFVSHRELLRQQNADFICFSGSLNTIEESLAQALVQDAFDAAAQGVVFNFLSDRPHKRWECRCPLPARRFDTAAWVKWSLTLTSRVVFTQAYLDGHDATIMLLHD